MKLHRNLIFTQQEIIYLLFLSNRWLNRKFAHMLKGYLLKMCPKEYHEHMIPKHPPGCKRLIVDSNYLSSLSRPNLTPNFDGISRITEGGILTQKGENMAFDVVIFATGFTADDYPFPVRGVKGNTIRDYYAANKGPTAYMGTTIPGFPNYYILSGPNTVTGHASVIFSEEVQVNYALQLIEPVIKGTASSFEVKEEATDKYNDMIQYRLSRSVFTQCVSWYRAGGDGKVSSIFPGPLTLFWWWLRSPVWKDYKAVGAERWVKQRRVARIRQFVGFISLSVFSTWLLSNRVPVVQLWTNLHN